MNSGPDSSATLGEILLAVFFVLLVFGVFLFALAAPLAAFVSTHKERWLDYSRNRKISLIARTLLMIAVIAAITYVSFIPTSELG